MNPVCKKLSVFGPVRYLCTSVPRSGSTRCKVLVVGGGSGGCAVAARFARKLPPKEVVVLDPADRHYYQPMFTLVGAGIKDLPQSYRSMESVLPKNANWIKDSVEKFLPENNQVITKGNHTIEYDYLVIAVGLKLNYDAIPGLKEALDTKGSGVCSIYSPNYAEDTWRTIQDIKKGHIIFTFPNSPVKCPGAPQKICYLAEDYYRKNGVRDSVNIVYNTSLPVIFGVKKYADALWKVANGRDVKVNLRTNLIEINHNEKKAVFQNLDKPEEKSTVNFDLLHVTPPMSTPESLRSCKSLVNAAGFLELNKQTMQHVKFENVFGIGDCTDTPNSKTAATAAAQTPVLADNLAAVMEKKELIRSYDGYASCPLVTSYNKCILAEFDYNLSPLETFPINQAVERTSMFHLKKDLLPFVYWKLMTTGYWNGPGLFRKIMHPFS